MQTEKRRAPPTYTQGMSEAQFVEDVLEVNLVHRMHPSRMRWDVEIAGHLKRALGNFFLL